MLEGIQGLMLLFIGTATLLNTLAIMWLSRYLRGRSE